MESFKSRFQARVVAIIHLILCSISVIGLIWLFVLAVGATTMEPNIQNQVQAHIDAHGDTSSNGITAKQATQLGVALLWVIFVVATCTFTLDFVAAVKLYNATEMVTLIGEPVGCVKKARFWYIVSIVFQVFSFIDIILILLIWSPEYLIITLIGFILRLVGILIVRRFIAEVEVSVVNTLPITNNQGHVQMGTGITHHYSPPSYDDAGKL